MKRLQEKKIYELDGGKVIVEDGIAQLTLRTATTIPAGWQVIWKLPVKAKSKFAGTCYTMTNVGGFQGTMCFVEGDELYVYAGEELAGTFCFSFTYEVA